MKKILLILLYLTFTLPQLLAQKTILWKITNKESDKVSYMLGTYHYMSNSFTDSLPVIKEKLLKSDITIFESIDTLSPLQALIDKRSVSHLIKESLSYKDLDYLIKKSENWAVSLYKLSPAELVVKLESEYYKEHCGTIREGDQWQHFDDYLIYLAKKNKQKIMGLETDSIQLNSINKESKYADWESSKKSIHTWIVKHKNSQDDSNLCNFPKRYMTLDLDYNFNQSCPNDIILAERNQNWMRKIPALLRKSNVFIAVGLFHLYYRCGLIQQLRQIGFEVEAVSL